MGILSSGVSVKFSVISQQSVNLSVKKRVIPQVTVKIMTNSQLSVKPMDTLNIIVIPDRLWAQPPRLRSAVAADDWKG